MTKHNLFFDVAFSNILKTEGGYVDHPNDKGDATKFGITIYTLSDYRGHPVTEEDVKSLTQEEAKRIYKDLYWDRLKLSEVDNINLCLALFDQGVNRGTRKVTEQIQKILGLKVDGIFGPVTLQAVNAMNPRKLLLFFIFETQKTYVNIAVNDPTQLVFLKGWIARTHKLLELV